jgi:hypothetical protein
VVHFWSRSHRKLVGGEDEDALRKADNELCAAYDRWVKHVTGTIEVTFRMAEMDESVYSLEVCQRALKRFLPQFTGNAAVTIVS